MDRDEEVIQRFDAHMRGAGRIRLAADNADRANAHLWPESLDLEALAEHEPLPPTFIVTDWLPCGYATLLAGHGGVGKSGIALHFGICVAAGVPFLGRQVERRRVLYLSCEDRKNILHWRLWRICRHLGVDLASLRGWFEVLDLVGKDTILWERDARTGACLTTAYGVLAERITQYKTQLLMVDGISDAFAGSEISRADVKRFVNALLSVIDADEGAVLLIGHINKPSATATHTTEGYSGSTQWHNAVRARWYLYPELSQDDETQRMARTGDLLLELQKSNFGPMDQSMRFYWDEEAKMFLTKETITSRLDRTHQDTMERDGVLRAILGCARAGVQVPAARSGPRTTLHVLRERPELPKTLGNNRSGRSRFWRCVEQLQQAGEITRQDERNAQRQRIAVIVVNGLRVRAGDYDKNSRNPA